MILILAALLVISALLVVRCREEASIGLEDGEYLGYSTASARGYVEVAVNIENDEITAVDLTEYQAEPGAAKGEDYGYQPFHEARELLPERFIAANSSEIDTVSGATSTSNMAIEAVASALEKAGL